MIIPALLATWVMAHQGAKVSIDLQGVRLSNAAPEIAKALGLPSLNVGPSIANEILLVRARDVEPIELRKQIEKVLNATFEEKANGWTLYQTEAQKDQDKKLASDERKAAFGRIIDKARKKVGAMPAFDANYIRKAQVQFENLKSAKDLMKGRQYSESLSKLESLGPADRLVKRVVSRLTPEMVSLATPDAPRVVFSTQPTAMQRPLPVQISDIIAQTESESSAWREFIDRVAPASNGTNEDASEFPDRYNGRREIYLRRPEGLIKAVTVSFDLITEGFEVKAYNEKGQIVHEGYVWGGDEDESSSTPALSYKEELAAMRKRAVPINEDGKDFLDRYYPIGPESKASIEKRPIRPSLLEKLLQPETFDPLSIAAVEVIQKTVKEPNIAVVLTDDMLYNRDFEAYSAKLEDTDFPIRERDGVWFTMHPRNPVLVRSEQMDRTKLGPLMRMARKMNRQPNIEERSAFAYSLPWAQQSSDKYMEFVNLVVLGTDDSDYEKEPLRILATLPQGLTKEAKAAGIPFGRLPDSTKLEVLRAIYFSDFGFSYLQYDYPQFESEDPKVFEKFSKEMEEYQKDVYREATFAVPNGITSTMVLKITEESQDGLLCNVEYSGDDYFDQTSRTFVDAGSLGSLIYEMTHPEKGMQTISDDVYRSKFNDEGIRIGTQRTVSVRVYVGPRSYYEWTTEETKLKDSNSYTTKTLPEPYRTKVQESYTEYEKMAKEREKYMKEFESGGPKNGGGVRRTPPPPPLR